jgi:hypothetical protein
MAAVEDVQSQQSFYDRTPSPLAQVQVGCFSPPPVTPLSVPSPVPSIMSWTSESSLSHASEAAPPTAAIEPGPEQLSREERDPEFYFQDDHVVFKASAVHSTRGHS